MNRKPLALDEKNYARIRIWGEILILILTLLYAFYVWRTGRNLLGMKGYTPAGVLLLWRAAISIVQHRRISLDDFLSLAGAAMIFFLLPFLMP